MDRISRSRVCCLIIAMIWLCGSISCAETITHLQYGGHGKEWVDYVKAMAVKFEQLNPGVKVEVQELTSSQYWDAIYVRAAGGVPVDVYELYPATAAPYLQQNLILDLMPFIQKDNEVRLDAWIPAAVDGFTYEGKLWSIPNSAYPLVHFYNVDMYMKEGLPTPSQLRSGFTWSWYLEAAKKMTKDNDGNGTIDQYGIWNTDDLWRWFMYVNQAGGAVLNRMNNPDKSLFNTEAARIGLQFLVDQFYTYKVAPTNIWGPFRGDQAFQKGLIGNIQVYGPSSIATFAKFPECNFDISPQPAGPDNNASALFLNGWQISSTSTHPELAWKWIKFLAYNTENAREFTRMTNRVPVLRRVLPEYRSLLPKAPASMWALDEVMSHPKTLTEYVTPFSNQIRNDVRLEVTKAINGQIPVETALAAIHNRVTVILAGGK